MMPVEDSRVRLHSYKTKAPGRPPHQNTRGSSTAGPMRAWDPPSCQLDIATDPVSTGNSCCTR